MPTPADLEVLQGLERSEVAQGLLEKLGDQQGSLTERSAPCSCGLMFPLAPRQLAPQQRTLGTDLDAGGGTAMLGRRQLRLPEAPGLAGRRCQSCPEGQLDSGEARARVLHTPSVTGMYLHTHAPHTRVLSCTHVYHTALSMYTRFTHTHTHVLTSTHTHSRVHICTRSRCALTHTPHTQTCTPTQLSAAHSGACVLTVYTRVTCTDTRAHTPV